MWLESNGERGLKDIANALGVSSEQVRKWKHTDNWDEQLPKEMVTLPNAKSNVTKRRRGAPLKNKNAVGNNGGAPTGNKNGFKHGAYERVMAGLLEPDETEIFNDERAGENVELELRRTLAALNAREVRLTKRITQIKESSKDMQVLDSVMETIEAGSKGQKHKPAVQTTRTVSIFDALGKLETELDRVQGRKIKVLSTLENTRVTRERLELEKKRLELSKPPQEDSVEDDALSKSLRELGKELENDE